MLNLLGPLVNGLLLGGLYAAIGIGLSMVFGIMRQVNLAHGVLMIAASYFALLLSQVLGINPFLSLFIIVPSMFLIGYMLQYILFNKFMQVDMEPFLMVSFGLSIILENILLLVFTPDAQSIVTSLSLKSIDLFGIFHISVMYLTNFGVGIILLIAIQLFMKKTYLGLGISAASDNVKSAKLIGINTKHVYACAMGVAIVTASISGVLVGMTFTFYPHSGTQYLIIAFGVVIIGGLGSLPGTFLGGLVLGISQLYGGRILGPGFQLLSGYMILLILLTLKPQGLFGRR